MPPTLVALGPGASFFVFVNNRAKLSASDSKGLRDAYLTLKSSKGTPYCCAFGTDSFFISFKERPAGTSGFLGTNISDIHCHSAIQANAT